MLLIDSLPTHAAIRAWVLQLISVGAPYSAQQLCKPSSFAPKYYHLSVQYALVHWEINKALRLITSVREGSIASRPPGSVAMALRATPSDWVNIICSNRTYICSGRAPDCALFPASGRSAFAPGPLRASHAIHACDHAASGGFPTCRNPTCTRKAAAALPSSRCSRSWHPSHV